MSAPLDPLLGFRSEFPILDTTTYLISNSLGAMPQAAAGALAEYAMVDGEFPSIRYVYEGLDRRLGAEILTVAASEGDGLAADEERIAAAIDEGGWIVRPW